MTAIQIEFLVGLYFVVLDFPVLFSNPFRLVPLFRIILGIILIVMAFFGFSIIR